jgi:hypothetical protein
MRQTQEYHEAHLAFARAEIVTAAAQGERVAHLLRAYTADVICAERDRQADEAERKAPA